MKCHCAVKILVYWCCLNELPRTWHTEAMSLLLCQYFTALRFLCVIVFILDLKDLQSFFASLRDSAMVLRSRPSLRDVACMPQRATKTQIK